MELNLYILILLLSGAAVFAQEEDDEEVLVAESTISCLVGATVDGVGNFTLVECGPSDDTCQTKIEVRGDTTRVWGECKSKASCRNNAKNNPKECHSKEAKEKELQICFKCCNTDGCNNNPDLPPEPRRRK